MARILLPLAGLLLLAAGLALLVDMPGDVLVHWRDFEISTSVAFLTGLIGGAIIFSILLFEILRILRAAPGRLKNRRERRQETLGIEAVTDSLLAIAAGNGEEAQRFSEAAERHLDRPALTLLLNAQTAQLNNDDEAATRHFEGMLADERTVLLGYRGLINQATRKGDAESALDLARKAKAAASKKSDIGWLNGLLFDLEAKALNWANAEEVLSASLKAREIDASEHKRSRALIKFEEASEAARLGNVGDAISSAETTLRDLPQFQPNVALLASLLIKSDKKRRAQRILLDAWAVAPHPDLAAAFDELEALETPEDRLERCQRLTERNPEHIESYLYVAEAALTAQNWDKARDALDLAYDLSVEARVCRLKADLVLKADGNEASAREWRFRADAASQGPGWICDSCSQRHGEWHLHCEGCATFGSLRWRDPIAVLQGESTSEIITLSDEDLTDMPHIVENESEPEGETSEESATAEGGE